MVRKYHVLTLVFGFVLLTSAVSAASFGTFPMQLEKQTSDLEVEYSIGFINPSSSPVKVTLYSEKSDEYNLSFSEKSFTIPSSRTDDPSGSGWYHLRGGEYTKINRKSFSVDISRYREDNQVVFPVRIESAVTDGDGGEGSQSRIIQVRNYGFRAVIDPSLRPEEREDSSESSWKDNFWREENSGSEEDFNLDQDQSSNQESPESRQKSGQTTVQNSSEQQIEDSGNGSLVNQTTLILVIGIIVSLGYIIMEV